MPALEELDDDEYHDIPGLADNDEEHAATLGLEEEEQEEQEEDDDD